MMKVPYWILFSVSVSFLFLSSCEDRIDENVEWDNAINDIAGKYKVTAIKSACIDQSLDLDGDGEAHSDLMLEFTGLPNGLDNIMYTNVTTAATSDRTGYINLNFPIQGIYERNGEIVPEWLIGGSAYLRVTYTVSDDYRIITEDIKELDTGTQDPNRLDLNTLSDIHVSFSGPGEMQLEVSCLLYDFEKGKAEKERIVYTFKRYEV